MSRKFHNPNLVKYARELRKNETQEERRLWHAFLVGLPVRFMRQKIIGQYIVDFCCVSKKVIVELDGAQHYELEAKEKDAVRDAYLSALGYRVLRYSDREVNADFRGVCGDIWNHLFEDSPAPTPPPQV